MIEQRSIVQDAIADKVVSAKPAVHKPVEKSKKKAVSKSKVVKKTTKPKPRKRAKRNLGGRPTSMTKLVIGKLEQAFGFGATDREACFYAGINPDTLYEYQKKNPKFTERKELLKERPLLIARESVVKGMKDDPNLALKYLERKNKAEFSPRTEHTGADGMPIQHEAKVGAIMPNQAMFDEMTKIHEKYSSGQSTSQQ